MYLDSPTDDQAPDGELYLGHARCTWGRSLRKTAGSPPEIYGRATVQAIVQIPGYYPTRPHGPCVRTI